MYRLSSLFSWFNDEIIFVCDEVLEKKNGVNSKLKPAKAQKN